MCWRARPTAALASAFSSTRTPSLATARTSARVSGSVPTVTLAMPAIPAQPGRQAQSPHPLLCLVSQTPCRRCGIVAVLARRGHVLAVPARLAQEVYAVGTSSDVPSLRRGLALLRLLATRAGPVSAGTVARELGL